MREKLSAYTLIRFNISFHSNEYCPRYTQKKDFHCVSSLNNYWKSIVQTRVKYIISVRQCFSEAREVRDFSKMEVISEHADANTSISSFVTADQCFRTKLMISYRRLVAIELHC